MVGATGFEPVTPCAQGNYELAKSFKSFRTHRRARAFRAGHFRSRLTTTTSPRPCPEFCNTLQRLRSGAGNWLRDRRNRENWSPQIGTDVAARTSNAELCARLIPSRLILEIKVVRGRPSRAAAPPRPPTAPSVFWRV